MSAALTPARSSENALAHRALLRWAFGLGQILGATVTLLLLATSGVREPALAGFVGTTVLTGLSRYLFRD